MINLDGTQTVNDICRSCTIGSINCIVNVHFENGTYGITRTYHIDDAHCRYNVYRMEISAVSNAVILDLYNY